MAYAINRSPPKAEATGSNPVGCATLLPLCANDLAHFWHTSENSLRSGCHTLVTLRGAFYYGNLQKPQWQMAGASSAKRSCAESEIVLKQG